MKLKAKYQVGDIVETTWNNFYLITMAHKNGLFYQIKCLTNKKTIPAHYHLNWLTDDYIIRKVNV